MQADKYQQSWMGWALAELYNDDGSANSAMVSTLSRTYPMAVAGNLHEFSYANDTKHFLLNFEANIAITQPTEIYLNEKLNYPDGYTFSLLFLEHCIIRILQVYSTHNSRHSVMEQLTQSCVRLEFQATAKYQCDSKNITKLVTKCKEKIN